jgi:hypothetical protein
LVFLEGFEPSLHGLCYQNEVELCRRYDYRLRFIVLTGLSASVTILPMTRVYISRILSFCGILAPPAMIVFILLAGHFTPGYSHINDTVSKLSEQGSQSPGLMTVGFISYGVLVIGFSCALYLRLRHGFRAYIAWFTLMLYGICMILAGIYQDSPGGSTAPLNPEGIVHNAVIITSCISMLIGMWAFAGSVYKKPSWFGFTWFTIAASFVGLVLSVIFAVQSYIPASGLLQRLFYLIILIWIETVSLWLFRLSFKS